MPCVAETKKHDIGQDFVLIHSLSSSFESACFKGAGRETGIHHTFTWLTGHFTASGFCLHL